MLRYEDLVESADWLRRSLPEQPSVAVVLGSGLGAFAGRLENSTSIPYRDIPHWRPSAVVGHEGRLVVGRKRGHVVAALAGRIHLYEGYDVRQVVLPVRVMCLLGVRSLILTNAAGGVNTAFESGTLMIIEDHINLMGANPLTGSNDDRIGPRFPDMTEVYSRRLRQITGEAAGEAGLVIASGVYAAVAGPSYETPAEIRYLRAIGADAVGMSTVPEAIAARHMGLDVLGLSCITNMAAGVLPTPLDHREVMETARRVQEHFINLVEAVIERM
jgi:purine-nucleoside phosphorylase